MDRVAADLERAWNEVESELRTISFQLDDELFRARAKPHELEDLERRRARARERRHWIELNRERTWTTGTLPSPQTGLWEPLPLNPAQERSATAPAFEEDEDDADETGEATPTVLPETAPEPPTALSREQQLQILADLAGFPMTGADEIERFELALQGRHDDVEFVSLAAMFRAVSYMPRQLRRRIRRDLKALGLSPPVLPKGLRAVAVSPPVILNVGASVDDGLAKDERHVLEELRKQGFEHGADLKPVTSLRCELPLKEVRRVLWQLSHPLATKHPLVEGDEERTRLSVLGQSLFGPDGAWLALPFPLLLLRGVDGIPSHDLGEVLRAARSALIAVRADLPPDTSALDSPDFSWGGTLEFVTRAALHDSSDGMVTVGSKVECMRTLGSVRARIRVHELPPQLSPDEVAHRIRALDAPGVERVEVQQRDVEIDLTHTIYALWLRLLIHRHSIGQATWRVHLPVSMRQLITQPFERIVARVLSTPGGPLDELEATATRLEGLLVFLELGERALHVLRDAETPAETSFALTHLASDALRSSPSFAHHTPLSPGTIRDAAERVVLALNQSQPLSPQRVRGDYSTGLSGAQAEDIAGKKSLKSLVRSTLLRELRDVVDELTRRRAQHTERERALKVVDAELTRWIERFQPSRRTWKYRAW